MKKCMVFIFMVIVVQLNFADSQIEKHLNVLNWELGTDFKFITQFSKDWESVPVTEEGFIKSRYFSKYVRYTHWDTVLIRCESTFFKYKLAQYSIYIDNLVPEALKNELKAPILLKMGEPAHKDSIRTVWTNNTKDKIVIVKDVEGQFYSVTSIEPSLMNDLAELRELNSGNKKIPQEYFGKFVHANNDSTELNVIHIKDGVNIILNDITNNSESITECTGSFVNLVGMHGIVVEINGRMSMSLKLIDKDTIVLPRGHGLEWTFYRSEKDEIIAKPETEVSIGKIKDGEIPEFLKNATFRNIEPNSVYVTDITFKNVANLINWAMIVEDNYPGYVGKRWRPGRPGSENYVEIGGITIKKDVVILTPFIINNQVLEYIEKKPFEINDKNTLISPAGFIYKKL